MEVYTANEEVKEYVDKYCKSNDCSIEEALSHEMVKNYIRYLKDNNRLKRGE